MPLAAPLAAPDGRRDPRRARGRRYALAGTRCSSRCRPSARGRPPPGACRPSCACIATASTPPPSAPVPAARSRREHAARPVPGARSRRPRSRRPPPGARPVVAPDGARRRAAASTTPTTGPPPRPTCPARSPPTPHRSPPTTKAPPRRTRSRRRRRRSRNSGSRACSSRPTPCTAGRTFRRAAAATGNALLVRAKGNQPPPARMNDAPIRPCAERACWACYDRHETADRQRHGRRESTAARRRLRPRRAPGAGAWRPLIACVARVARVARLTRCQGTRSGLWTAREEVACYDAGRVRLEAAAFGRGRCGRIGASRTAPTTSATGSRVRTTAASPDPAGYPRPAARPRPRPPARQRRHERRRGGLRQRALNLDPLLAHTVTRSAPNSPACREC